MRSVSLADAKAHLSELVEAAAGSPVCITRRGKAVAQIIAIDRPRKQINPATLRAPSPTPCPLSRSQPANSLAGCGTKIAIDALSRHVIASRGPDQ